MNISDLDVGFQGPDDAILLEAIVGAELFTGYPDSLEVDGRPAKLDRGFGPILSKAKRDLTARWRSSPKKGWLAWNRGIIKTYRADFQLSAHAIQSLLAKVPFHLSSAPTVSSQWGSAGAPIETDLLGFSDGHWNHGWMCAFKGKGHDRLVSRRWLDYGPWRLIRDETHDLSIVQFHDLNADDETALAQAKPGHERMGISETGGFIQTDFVWEHQSGASYDPVNQTLLYVVYGRTVSQEEMLEAAAVKLWQPLAKPVKQVAYVFMDEKAARAHLHEAWLHNVEARTFINGAEVILTETYEPPAPKVPDWVKRLQDQEGR